MPFTVLQCVNKDIIYIHNRHTTYIHNPYNHIQSLTYKDILHTNNNTIKIYVQQCNTHEY